jgi:hypothetical protein
MLWPNPYYSQVHAQEGHGMGLVLNEVFSPGKSCFESERNGFAQEVAMTP